MWKLVPAAGEGEPYRLLSGAEYVVGRKNCAILLQDDQSISRSHAVLLVTPPGTTSSQSLPVPVLTVTDTSKYGTFVNGAKLNGTSVSLQPGDRINFGVFESKFRVEYEPLVVCSSCLDVAQKTALNQAIQKLGGLVVNEWTRECTHLVMVSVKVTVKTICALICGRPIIKPEFFVELIKAVQSRQQLPNPESDYRAVRIQKYFCDQPENVLKLLCEDRCNTGCFYPPVDEPSIGTEKLDLSEHHERKKVFSGKTFVFLTAKQQKKLGPAVVLGGGEAKLMTEGGKATSLLVSPEVCVVDVGLTNSQIPGSDSLRNWTDSILAVLQSKGLRAIPEAEIGLAVIFMSTEKYCNPQKQPGNKAVSTGTAAAAPGRAMSQSVDELMMPAAAEDSTLCVPDTPAEEQMCREMENPPQLDRGGQMSLQHVTAVQKHPGRRGRGTAGVLAPGVSTASGFSQKNPASSLQSSEAGPSNEHTSHHHSNTITSYFQTVRKRERPEEGETSVPKLAKLEERLSPVAKRAESTAAAVWDREPEQHQKENNILEPNSSFALEETKYVRESGKPAREQTACKSTSLEKHAPKKRKELDDLSEDRETLEIVFGSRDLDWEDQMTDHDQEAEGNAQKKRCLEATGRWVQEVNVKQREENKPLKKEEPGSVLTSAVTSEIKQESPALNPREIPDDSSNLPSRLVLTEFRSLVVSQPIQSTQPAGGASHGAKRNFKAFRKVTYPGAGQLPYIIGGSDLVAHHAKKNSELEDWLRQEMEEQGRQAREESLADDLFRYDPSVKRRR